MKRIATTLLCMFLLGNFLYAQSGRVTVSGKVINALSGEPLIGVNVLVKKAGTGDVTDIEGNYKLTLEAGNLPTTIEFSFIGYVTESREVSSAITEINVEMIEDITRLDEIVVSGLASSVKRSNLANAVSTISGEELTGITTQATMDGALYGKVTGATITQSSGAPGGGIAIRLRGISSVTGQNQPLFIIDGVYISNAEVPNGSRFASGANAGNEENSSNRIADIDPNDIENIEILKGPSAAAIYGTRANAGVVIITTKKGKQGKTAVSFSQDVGFNKIQRYMGIREFDEATVAAEFSAAEAERFRQARAAGEIFDYERELYGETGLITDSRLSVSGGDAKTKFLVGASLRDEDGIVKNTGYNRASIRANIDHKINKRINLSVNTNYVRSSADRGFTGNENEGGLSLGYNLAFTRPWANLFPDQFGNYPDNPNAAGNMLFVRDNAINREDVNRFIQGTKLNIDLFSNDISSLRFTWNGGIDYYQMETYVYVPEIHQAQRGLDNGYIGIGKNTFSNFNNQGFLVYDLSALGGDLQLSSQVGYSYLNFNRDLMFMRGTQLIPGQTTLGQAGAQRTDQTLQREEEFGFVVQQEANFKNQFIATVGVRADKSSLNSDPNQYYYFPKASLAMNIANMDFWSVNQVNLLKLRAAYGETGSSATFGALFTSFAPTNIGGSPGTIVQGARGADNLIPETAAEFEIGIDISMFDNNLGLEATYYNRAVRDLILPRGLSPSSGFTQEITNLADMVNRGLELSLTARPVQSENFKWTTTTNFWFNRSEVTRLDVPAFPAAGTAFGLSLGTFFIEEGQPITQLKGAVAGEAVTIGDVEPDFQMGFFHNFNFYKNFDFGFLLHWQEGGDILNLTTFLTDLGRTTVDLDQNPDRINPDVRPGAYRYIEDGSYLRLREISLYYKVPKAQIQSAFNGAVEGIRVGVSARNPWTLTNYIGYDPEVSTKGGAGLSRGVDVNPFPSSKQFYFHFNITF